MGLLALQGAHDQVASAQERVKGLRGTLLLAVKAATLPGTGIIVTPPLAKHLQESLRVRCHLHCSGCTADTHCPQCVSCFQLCSCNSVLMRPVHRVIAVLSATGALGPTQGVGDYFQLASERMCAGTGSHCSRHASCRRRAHLQQQGSDLGCNPCCTQGRG